MESTEYEMNSYQYEPQAPAAQPRENVFTGTIGALVGALIGGGCIIGLSQIGFIASLSGLVLAVCTLKGYELLGKRLSKTGIFISVLLMLVTPYLADRIDWAIVLMQQFPEEGLTFGESFALIPLLIEDESIAMADYLKNLGMIYLLTILGAFSTLRGLRKK